MAERPLSQLAREIAEGAVRLSAATAAWLLLVGEFDERGGWGGTGSSPVRTGSRGSAGWAWGLPANTCGLPRHCAGCP